MQAALLSLPLAAAVIIGPSAPRPVHRPASQPPSVVTYHSDNLRTGWNSQETILTQAAVASTKFGVVQQFTVDGTVDAQPLYYPNLVVSGSGKHNVLIVATEHDSVYAFDADTFTQLWHTSFSIPSQNIGPEPSTDTNCKVVQPWIGISSTPVIDPATQTLYVMAKTVQTQGSTTTYFQTLHALSLATGTDKVPPVIVAGSFKLSNGQTLTFTASNTYDRAGLLIANGAVYSAFSTTCDGRPTVGHGWVFSYAEKDLSPAGGFNTTLDTTQSEFRGSIWQSSYGIAGDATGNVYFVTANGAFDAFPTGENYGDSVVRMSPSLTVQDYFTPFNEAYLEQNDLDFGSGGVMLLPDQPGTYPHLAVAAGKSTAIYLLNRDDLGEFTPSGPDRVLQTIPFSGNGVWGGPAYFADASGTYVYYALQGPMMALRLATTPAPMLTVSSQTQTLFNGYGGTIPAVSSNGTVAGSGVVWATTRPGRGLPGPVFPTAFNADDLSQRLFVGLASFRRQTHGSPFVTPTIARGRVFVGGEGVVTAFGLH